MAQPAVKPVARPAKRPATRFLPGCLICTRKKLTCRWAACTACWRSWGTPKNAYPRSAHCRYVGKGSTLAFCAFLQANGHCVNAIPRHIWNISTSASIAVRRLTRSLSEFETLRGRKRASSVTFFEITTAAAFCAFAETPADFLLLEVGLGAGWTQQMF